MVAVVPLVSARMLPPDRVSASHRTEAQQRGFGSERKKGTAAVEFSRLLRKPGKRNKAGLF